MGGGDWKRKSKFRFAFLFALRLSFGAAVIRYEDIGITNPKHYVEELIMHRTNRIVVILVQYRNATDFAISVYTVPPECGGGVVVHFPVGSEHAAVIERVRANDCVAHEFSLTRDVNTTERIVQSFDGTNFGIQIVAERFVFTEQMNGVIVFIVCTIADLFEEGSAFEY